MRIGAALAAGPAAVGAAALARALLDEADAAAARLAAREDEEALHAFRVALRRLRTVLGAFRPALGGAVRKRHLRRLAALARATGAARDAEVQLAWLEAERASTPPAAEAGVRWLAARLRRRARSRGGQRVLAAHRRLARRLRARLAALEEAGPPPAGAAFGPALAALLRPRRDAFVEGVAAVRGARDVEAAHGARIEGKRLRYLLEPLRGARGADARAAVARLKGLQDRLGELHDAHVLEALLAAARRRARGRRRRGLAALARRARARCEACFAAVSAARAAGELEALGREVEAVAAGLERRGRRLRAVPPRRAPIAARRPAASTMMRAPRGARDPERR